MRLIGWLLSSLALFGVLGIAAAVAAVIHFSRDLPDHEWLAQYEPPVTTRLYAADGQLLEEYAAENRLFVPIEAIPYRVVQAFVSAEDRRFRSHLGIDLIGIGRAALTNVQNLGSNRRLVGASTITQQVAKNLLLRTNEVSYTRKIREALLALRIEQTLSKDDILELYLNQIYLGRGSHGIAAAALNYFNRSLPELTLAQAAYLAGLPKAPNNYPPGSEAAFARRDYVLNRMVEDGAITQAEAEAARAEPIEVEDRQATEFYNAAYFAEEVRREMAELYGDQVLYEGGLAVRTSLEPEYQTAADNALRNGLIAYDRRHGWRGPVTRLESIDDWPNALTAVPKPDGSGPWQLAVVLAVDAEGTEIGLAGAGRPGEPASADEAGEIASETSRIPFAEMRWARPWREGQRVGAVPGRPADVVAVGDVVLVERLGTPASAGYGLRQIPDVQGAIVVMDPHTGRVLAMSGGYDYDLSQFNRATQARRQPGSAFKPFVYLAALEHGYTPGSLVRDLPLAVDQGGGLGLWRPSNYSHDFLGPTPLRVGIERSRNVMTVRLLLDVGLEPVRDIARDFGIYEDMPLVYSMALGAGETTPLALTTAYAMLANGANRITPTFVDRVQGRDGATIYRHDERPCRDCALVGWSGQTAPEPPDIRESVFDPAAAFQLVNMMEGVVQRGTAARLRPLAIPLAGKTGTTNDYRDAWFIGFTPDLVVGVFVGFDAPRSLGRGEAGSTAAVPIFGDFMGQAMAGRSVPPFRIPPGIRLVRVDPATGAPASPGGPAIWEAYQPGTEPTARRDPFGNGGLGAGPLVGDPVAAPVGTGGLY